MLDAEGFVTSWNAGAHRITGYARKEIMGRHFSCFYRPEDIGAGRPDHVLKSAATAGKYQEDSLQVRKNGSVFWATVRLTGIRNSAGRFYGFAATVADNSALRAEEQTFRNLFDAAPDAMVVVNPKGKIIKINAQAEKLFGFKRQELLGEPIEVLIPQRFHETHRQDRRCFFTNSNGRPMGGRRELWAVRKDRTEFKVAINLRPCRTPDAMLVTAAIRAIADGKELERRIQEQGPPATAAAAGIFLAHEVAKPLYRIFGALDLLKAQIESSEFEPSAAQATIDNARTEMERLKRLLANCRSVGRLHPVKAETD
jgi:PAS domain S-box-containing protein